MSFKEKLKDFMFGKKCPHCKDGRLNEGSLEGKGHQCSECGYKEK